MRAKLTNTEHNLSITKTQHNFLTFPGKNSSLLVNSQVTFYSLKHLQTPLLLTSRHCFC